VRYSADLQEVDRAELLAPREAANILGISYPTLKQWIYHGKIKSVKTPAAPPRAGERDLTAFFRRSWTWDIETRRGSFLEN